MIRSDNLDLTSYREVVPGSAPPNLIQHKVTLLGKNARTLAETLDQPHPNHGASRLDHIRSWRKDEDE